jgi:hypothetical protein
MSEALKQALEGIQKYEKETGKKLTLRANKLVLEPDELTIAYMSGLYDGKKAQRTWVGLTDEQMLECNMDGDFMVDREIAKLNVQAKLRELNT